MPQSKLRSRARTQRRPSRVRPNALLSTRSKLFVTAFVAVFLASGVLIVNRSEASVIPGFEVFCFYTHMAQVDPIVAPGVTSAHMHDFAGNPSVNAFSTIASMRAAMPNCEHHGDTAGYWTPTLYYNGTAYHPDRLHSYYRWGNIPDVKNIKPIPAGLKMVAGDAHATKAQSTSVVGWNCGIQGQRLYSKPISCASGPKVVLHFFFPNCWNGRDLDSPDHKSHMAYSHNGKCPTTHPVAVTRLTEDFGYDLHKIDTKKLTLSSGSPYTAHADYWQTWKPGVIEDLTKRCVNAKKQCGPVTD